MRRLLIEDEDPNGIAHLKPDGEERDNRGDGIEADEGKNVGEEIGDDSLNDPGILLIQ